MKLIEGMYVIHLPTRTIGMVQRIFGKSEYVNDLGERCSIPVVQFFLSEPSTNEKGDAFLYDESNFEVLTELEVGLYSVTKQAVINSLVEIAEWAKAHDVDMDRSADIIVQVLKDQAKALGKI